jgi:hypothetical protein
MQREDGFHDEEDEDDEESGGHRDAETEREPERESGEERSSSFTFESFSSILRKVKSSTLHIFLTTSLSLSL